MNYKNLIFFFIIFITIIHFIIINLFPLLGDEAYYWQWSRHPDFAYYEQGPVLALVIFIFTLFNKINNEFTVRAGSVFFFTLTLIFCFLIYKKIYNDDKSQKNNFFNLIAINSSLLYCGLAILMMHDTIMIFFYTLLIYIFLFIIEKPEDLKYWAISGIIYAIAIMSKFTVLIIYPAIFLFIFLTDDHKKYLNGFLLFTFFSIIFLSPVVFWNINHNFANINYLLIRSGVEKNINLNNFLNFLVSQLLLLNPFLFFFFYISSFIKIKEKKTYYELFLSVIFIFPQIIFLVLSFKSKIEANWPGFIYLPAFFLATNYMLNSSNAFLKKYFYFSIIFGLTICSVIYLLLPFYANTPFIKSSNALSKSYGYKNIAIKVNNIYNELKQNNKIFMAARHYQVASLLAFYLNGNPEVYILIEHESSKNYRFWKEYKKLIDYNCLFIYSEDWESFEMEKFFEKNIKKINTINEANKILFIDYFIKYKGN